MSTPGRLGVGGWAVVALLFLAVVGYPFVSACVFSTGLEKVANSPARTAGKQLESPDTAITARLDQISFGVFGGYSELVVEEVGTGASAVVATGHYSLEAELEWAANRQLVVRLKWPGMQEVCEGKDLMGRVSRVGSEVIKVVFVPDYEGVVRKRG